MNDLIKYNNLLHEQGMNSSEAAAILQAHTGDADFERRARFVRFAHEARVRGNFEQRTQAVNKQNKRIIAWVLIILGLIVVITSILQ